jgi:NAD(P)-dependent dehydrogenase (short-subunit alcohol dehydrogenase family)
VQKRNATAAVIGAGDFIGSEIAKKFASEGFSVFAGRRNGDKLAPLVKEIESAGGKIHARSLDARKEEEITAFLNDADKHAPLEVCIFNVGANVNFPILDTTERVFRKVWEMACYSGFLAGREAARLMVPRGKGNIFFTGATASLRGGSGYAAFASAKFGLRAVAQAMARELGPKNISLPTKKVGEPNAPRSTADWVFSRSLAFTSPSCARVKSLAASRPDEFSAFAAISGSSIFFGSRHIWWNAASTYLSNTPSNCAAMAARIRFSVLTGKNGFQT